MTKAELQATNDQLRVERAALAFSIEAQRQYIGALEESVRVHERYVAALETELAEAQ